jgi:hypothetical protein
MQWEMGSPSPLSPKETEPRLAAPEEVTGHECFASVRMLLPLLGGEGVGEGERSS